MEPLHPRHDGHPQHLTLTKTLRQEISRRLRIHTPDRQEKVIAQRSEQAAELTAISHRHYWRPGDKRSEAGMPPPPPQILQPGNVPPRFARPGDIRQPDSPGEFRSKSVRRRPGTIPPSAEGRYMQLGQ